MAKIEELKKYLTHEFSSGSYTGEDYRTFQTKYLNYLRSLCKENHWQLVNVGKQRTNRTTAAGSTTIRRWKICLPKPPSFWTIYLFKEVRYAIYH